MPRVDILVKNAGIGDGAVLPGENQIEKSRRIKGLERCFSFIDSLHKVGYVQEAPSKVKTALRSLPLLYKAGPARQIAMWF